MRHKNFVLEDGIIQYRFSKKEIEDIGIDLNLVKSIKIFIQKQSLLSKDSGLNVRVLLSVTPTVTNKNISGFADKTRWFKTILSNNNLEDFHKKLFKITDSTNNYIKYTTCFLKENKTVIDIADKLAYKMYNETLGTCTQTEK